jgi:Uma2 family endonuclease
MASLPIAEGLVPLEEYLSRCYEPDCEYDDGLMVERKVGEFEHSFVQAILAMVFNQNMEIWGVYALTEQRVRIAPRKYRIPDVCVLRRSAPREKILTLPPLIAIEILSPEDRMRRIEAKAAEYLEFGIEHIWIIDPNRRSAWRGTVKGLEKIESGVFSIPDSPILLRPTEIFDRLDTL